MQKIYFVDIHSELNVYIYGFSKYSTFTILFLIMTPFLFYVHDLISSANLLKLNYVKSNQKCITVFTVITDINYNINEL